VWNETKNVLNIFFFSSCIYTISTERNLRSNMPKAKTKSRSRARGQGVDVLGFLEAVRQKRNTPSCEASTGSEQVLPTGSLEQPPVVASADEIQPTGSTEGNVEFVFDPIPVVSVHDQLGLHVAPATKNKIISGSYVDFAVLLESQPGEPAQRLNISSTGQFFIKLVQQS
jgi:hypothetical protein